jgi:hypothetical protein
MKTIIATLIAATLSTAAFASETTHNGQSVRGVSAVSANANVDYAPGFQGLASAGQNTASSTVIGADRGYYTGK